MARPVRYKIVGLLFSGTIINYIDRVNISVAAPVIMADSGWSKSEFGMVFSAFLVGYAVLQLPGGLVADRWSARKVLALAFCGFSLFTALTPPAIAAFWLLLSARFLVGMFESVTIPALTSVNARWIPRAEFGRAQTLSVSGVTVGQMIAYPLTTWIILHFSWQLVFYFNALLGFVWAAVWLWSSTDTPGEHPKIDAAERSYIESNLPPRPAVPLPLWTVFSSASLLTVTLAFMCFAYVLWMFLFWFPTYLVEARGMSLGVMGTVGIFMHGASFLGVIGAGMLSDWLLRNGWNAQFARVRFGAFGLTLALPCLVLAAQTSSPLICTVFLVLFYGLFSMGIGVFTTVALEFNPHQAGAIFGMMNTLGTFAGVLGPWSAGQMIEYSGGDWTIPLFVATGVGAVSALILFVVKIRKIEIEDVALAEAAQSGS